MKKVIAGIAICTLGFAADGMITLRNNNLAVARQESNGTLVRADRTESQSLVEQDDVSSRINFRKVAQPRVNGNNVSIRIRDCVKNGDDLRAVSDWYTREYPLQRVVLRYEHDFGAGRSYPVEKLFALVNDVEFADMRGEIVADPEFTNESRPLIHQRREQYVRDDANLRAKPYTEIFINTDSGIQVIDSKSRPETPFVSYTRTATPARTEKIGVPTAKPGDNEYDYQRTETSEEWMRPDGSIFTRKTENVQKVAKPKQPAPVPPKVQTIQIPVYRRVWRGGVFNRHSEWAPAGCETQPINCGYRAVYYGHSGDRMQTDGRAPY